MRLSLPPGIIERFAKTGETLAIVSDQVYFGADEAEYTKNHWSISGHRHQLYPAGSFAELERRLTGTKTLDAYLQFLDDIHRRARVASRGMLHDFCVATVQMCNTSPARDTSAQQTHTPKDNSPSYDIIDFPSPLNGHDGMLLCGGSAYALSIPSSPQERKACDGRTREESDDGYAAIDGTTYLLSRIGNTASLCARYKSQKEQHIVRQIMRLRDEMSQPRANSGSRNPSSSNNNYRFTRLDQDNYRIIKRVPRFLMGIKGEYYIFPQETVDCIDLGMSLNSQGDGFTIDNYPSVMNSVRKHPFVHDSGTICYNGNKRWQEIGLHCAPHIYEYSPTNSNRIRSALLMAESAITTGYWGEHMIPVRLISNFKPVANSKEGAIAAARCYGIDPRRIYENGC